MSLSAAEKGYGREFPRLQLKTFTNMKTTFTVKLGITDISPAELVVKGRNHVKAMTGSTIYTTPTPALATITAACDRLDEANQEVLFNGGKAAYDERNAAEFELRALIKELGGYVQAVSKGDRPSIRDGAGFDVVEPGQPIGELAPPESLGSRVTNMVGRVALDWKRVYGAKLYHVYMSTSNDPFNWVLTAVTTKSKLDLDSLDSGKFYWFAVSAIGAAGESSKSDPAHARAA